MFSNIGGKIKVSAKVLFVVGIAISIIVALTMFSSYNPFWGSDGLIAGGFAFLFGGPLVSLVSSFLVYGFGELIDRVINIERNIQNCNHQQAPYVNAQFKTQKDRISEVQQLYSKNLITAEEYKKAIIEIKQNNANRKA